MFPDVFQFLSTTNYLKAIYFYEVEKNPKLTLLQFSKNFGFKTHTAMQLFINGKRVMSVVLFNKIVKKYNLDKGRKFYFEMIYKIDRDPSLLNDPSTMKEIAKCRPLKFENNSTDIKEVDFMSSGLLQTCLELAKLKNFSIDKAPELLGNLFSKDEIAMAYVKLQHLGYIKDMKPTAKHFLFNEINQRELLDAVSNSQIWFKQLLLNKMISRDDINNSNWYTGIVLPINEELMADIRKFIGSKIEEFMKKFEAAEGTSNNLSYVSFCLERISK